jgi:hypothetical protein
MKYIIIVVLLTIGFSCSKDNDDDYCWTCEVQRMDMTKYTDKKCYDYPTAGPPAYEDANGNSLQVGPCQKNW